MFDEKGFILENIIRAFEMGKMIMQEVDSHNIGSLFKLKNLIPTIHIDSLNFSQNIKHRM